MQDTLQIISHFESQVTKKSFPVTNRIHHTYNPNNQAAITVHLSKQNDHFPQFFFSKEGKVSIYMRSL